MLTGNSLNSFHLTTSENHSVRLDLKNANYFDINYRNHRDDHCEGTESLIIPAYCRVECSYIYLLLFVNRWSSASEVWRNGSCPVQSIKAARQVHLFLSLYLHISHIALMVGAFGRSLSACDNFDPSLWLFKRTFPELRFFPSAR